MPTCYGPYTDNEKMIQWESPVRVKHEGIKKGGGIHHTPSLTHLP